MAKKEFGLVAVGNALVDVLAEVDEDFITQNGMDKGRMALIDDLSSAQTLYKIMPQAMEMSGGSVANSLAMFALLGGKGAFMGVVADDELGQIFTHDMKAQGLTYETPLYKGNLETGRCLTVITPDGERTMNTYLGASSTLGPAQIDAGIIGDAQITLIEGYAFDMPSGRDAALAAAKAAKDAGRKVAFTLSDKKCVERHFADFDKFVTDSVDIIIGNKKEIMALTLKDTFDEAAKAIAARCDMAALTKGGDGALIIDKGRYYDVAAEKVAKVVDTTGAGDAFAGAFLYGVATGMTPDAAGALGAKMAAKTIQHIGARSTGMRP